MGSMIGLVRRLKGRIITQVAALAGANLYFVQLRSICIPVLNCHSCPAAVFACPIGVLLNFSSLRIFPFVALGTLGLVGIIGGRWVCGWLCPFGLLQDGLHKIPTKKITMLPKLAYMKYGVLIGLVILIPYFFPNSAFAFCRICPAGTLESAIPWRIMGIVSGYSLRFYLRMAILLGVFALVIALGRGFCRLLCPLGAIFSIFNRYSLFRIRVTKEDCKDCGECAKLCPVGLNPPRQMHSPECIRCLKCTSTHHLKFGIR